MRTDVSFTRRWHGDHGVVRKSLTVTWAQIYDFVTGSGEDPYLGPLSCDHQSGGARNQDKEVRQGLGRVDTPIRRWPSSKNLCSALEVPVMKRLCVKLKMEKDWSFNMIGW